MPFGLTNAPATFSTMMNQVLQGFLDEFVMVYLDDIVVYSGTLAEHVEHLRQVLTRLREHELYAKVSKCSFAQESISFLGHIVERGRIRMDPKKVQAIEEWQPPSDVHDLRSFLGLANYYRHFVKGYSKIARPMTDLLKKTETWDWTPQCQVAFDNLKRAIVTNPMLALPDMSKPFTVETDASDFALGGVLMQDSHPIAFESRKLKDVERHYSVHEKELLAVVHCLRLWRHYLLGSPFMVKMDNIAVSHFMSQPKLTSRQAHWQELLSKFHFVLEYRAGSSNHVANALSRRADLATLGSVAALSSSAVATSVRDRARELLSKDPTAQGLVHLVEQGKARQFWLEEGLLMTKENRSYVPKGGDLRKSLISECHYTLWAGHPGEEHLCVGAAGLLLATDAGRCRDLCFNAQKSSSTNKSAFEIVTGQQPLLPHTLNSPQGVRSPLARSFSQEWKQNVEIARSCLEKAQKRMKKYADNNRRFVEFNAGDLVMVKVPDPRLSKSSRGRDPRLMQKYVGLYRSSSLKKYSAYKEDDARNQPSRPQLELRKTKEKVAKAILNHRVTSTAKRTHNEYLVKWKGCSSEENTWERVTNLKAFLPLVEAYHASHAPRTSPSQVGENVKGRPHSRHLDAHSATQPLNSADQQPSPTDAGLP
ncbi:Retrovirus-related Pol polyprotein from transposon.6 [Sesamum angolense]|uniref:Retrovirus-related Pol polyprotein from transposon.6 n=1 Tax=Sesamum angolense TaxID=2727404 RepID=A0AAE1T535_9LAMI|nr:Retrovirus-related Pol polyprotein from transposon.6 [Sesamum angolense]